MKEAEKHRQAFEVWFDLGRNTLEASKQIGVRRDTVYEWIAKFDWQARADKRDLEIQQAADRAAAKRRATILDRQARTADQLLARGVEFLRENKISRAADAIKACQIGIELARQAEGLPDWMVQVLGMTDDELEAERDRQLRLARLAGEGDPAGVGPKALPSGDEAGDDVE
jgi:transposase